LFVLSSSLHDDVMTLLQKEAYSQPSSYMDVPCNRLQLHTCHDI
jgi:hypothetical protein